MKRRDYIQNNYKEQISLKSLSKQFGINDFKIKTGFKLLFDSPVITFLIDTRLKHACQLLRESKLSISIIADEVGYGHANNFSAAFKRKYDLSPLEYRLNNRQG